MWSAGKSNLQNIHLTWGIFHYNMTKLRIHIETEEVIYGAEGFDRRG